MAWRVVKFKRNLKRILISAVAFCFLITVYLGITQLPHSKRIVKESNRTIKDLEISKQQNSYKIDVESPPNVFGHRLAVIVPFRDRLDELLVFGPFIHRYLNLKNISHDIVVVNQIDKYRFNRASLINAGFLYAANKQFPPCDYVVMHDVDLLPLNNDLPYEYPKSDTVTHIAAPGLHPKYNYPTFIGGILAVSNTIFQLVNGMSNIYWGWGLEDDEFYVRLKQNKIQVKRPTGVKTGISNTFRHTHSAKVRTRDQVKCFDQWNKTRKRDRLTGLDNLNYTLASISHMMIEEAPIVFLNVKLHCDTNISPWCDCYNSSISHNSTKVISSQNKSAYKHRRRKA